MPRENKGSTKRRPNLEVAEVKLKASGWADLNMVNPIERLKMNGIINVRATGARDMLSFSLDPIAEYLAAAALIEQSENEKDGLAKLFERVKNSGEVSEEFLFSLQQTAKLYGKMTTIIM